MGACRKSGQVPNIVEIFIEGRIFIFESVVPLLSNISVKSLIDKARKSMKNVSLLDFSLFRNHYNSKTEENTTHTQKKGHPLKNKNFFFFPKKFDVI